MSKSSHTFGHDFIWFVTQSHVDSVRVGRFRGKVVVVEKDPVDFGMRSICF